MEMPPEPHRGFRVCDWFPDTVDIRLDRGMMGDGLINIPGIRRMVESTDHPGHREVEIVSERNWWRKDPDDDVRIIAARHQPGSASRGNGNR